ncbi:ParB/RepB/Spo0J family partition protein [Bradyrhizobium sp. INPA01-394B]|jgi:ParB family chromosome partitioning protein|uniref:ParB-like partition protein n=2 Tax=Nitrobacteraceae TaxID=41294 RepID=K8P3G2_9BRAD|nr:MULTISPECIES: ParB/RepB/Spo0J family partition protein [Nitrobacteraceae]MAH71369.1 plasmid partitioning protein [Afipia sp.]OUX59563.1 MAG: plasmid partitioning protein [Afipia sp. TMED4]EKS32978.1 ParB-like partition protein [Afipia broomeae ATCC 49717]MBC9877609.1 ParB/RepB/Spo0J family partition protein [Bradyrhizobium campsiandrae]MBC9978150.1 ParB/RepB/Spo0J family partition protein [Bradyrhizobium campsiandrae]
MYLLKVDPRALVENPDHSRQTKSTPQADALLLASIKAVGIVQPPVVSQQADGGNGFLINAGRRRVRLAIAAGLEEIDVLVDDAANDNGAMRSFVENIAREPLNPVDQWRAIERLVALGWTEEAIGVALTLPVRQVRKLRLLANVLPAMLDHMAKGDMPDERQLRTIAAASPDEQKEVWKKHKPFKADPQVSWWSVAQALTKARMYARHASFGDDLAQAYGIQWVEDLFAPADEDSRYTTDVEAFLGAQQEWMAANLPKKGIIAEATNYGEVKLPPKAERVYGKPSKSDCTAMYLDRDGRVQTVHYRMPTAKKPKGKGASAGTDAADETGAISKPRPDVTRKGVEMIGDFRTDALHEALARAPIEDDALMALLILAFAGQNVSVASASAGTYYGNRRIARHAVNLFDQEGQLVLDNDALRVAARSILAEVLSCRENRTDSGIVARVAGDVVGADNFLPNMGSDDFLSCLSRVALEGSCKDTPVLPRQKVKDTRAALVEHFKEGRFVHPAALFAPDRTALLSWIASNAVAEDDESDEPIEDSEDGGEAADDEAFREAAE